MKTYRLIFVLLLFPFFTGCIEIVEKITVHSNKSGKASYSLNTNQRGFFLNNLAGFFDNSLQDEVILEAKKFANQLKNQPGISNVHINTDLATNNFELSFEFDNSKNLNNALYKMSGNKKTMFSPGYLKIKRHRLKKFNFSPWVKPYLERENIEIPDMYITSMITFSSIIELPEEIISYNPSSIKISHDSKIVKNSYSLQNIIEGKVNTGIRIKY
ncbi:MAG: hypothetical protein R2750_13750 [Bacteroidales bacterium]